MAKDYSRTQRVGDQIQRELAQLIQFELKDPRIGMITVSHVKVARDFGYADVYVTVMPLGSQTQEEATAASLSVLRQAAGFLRTELSHSLSLRIIPQLRFHYDVSVDRGRHLHSLIEKAYQQEQKGAASPTDSDESKE